MEVVEKQEDLQPEEKKKLFHHFIGIFIFIAIALVFLIVFFQNTDGTMRSILGVFSVFFIGVPLWMAYAYFADWSFGQKNIICGVVEDCKTSKMKDSNSQTTYSLVIGKKEIVVDFKHYAKVKTGDAVELHYAPKSGISFDIKVLESAKQTFDKKSNVKPITFDIKEDSYNEQDRKALKKQLFARLIPKIFTFLFMAWIVGGLAAAELYGVLILLFPFPIILIVCVYKITKEIYCYFSDKKMATKIIYYTQIEDKKSHQHRGTIYQIFTRTFQVNVSEDAYNAATVSHPIEVHVSKYSNRPLGIVISDKHYMV